MENGILVLRALHQPTHFFSLPTSTVSSTMEIAGLVAAAFPLCISAYEHSQGSRLQALIRPRVVYERRLDLLISELNSFRSIMINLLSPILPREKSANAYFLSYDHGFWSKSKLETALEGYMTPLRYTNFMDNLVRLETHIRNIWMTMSLSKEVCASSCKRICHNLFSLTQFLRTTVGRCCGTWSIAIPKSFRSIQRTVASRGTMT